YYVGDGAKMNSFFRELKQREGLSRRACLRSGRLARHSRGDCREDVCPHQNPWGRAMNLRNFFGELKRRNVYKVAIAYGVVAWLLMQVASQIFPFFEIPNWAVRLVVLLLVIGFPVAMILAWAFELTPEGIKRA